ncbi:hypothetical protein [Streptomyces boluensis]|uniref:Uncharacterized protein n=1 Tax=Streptomyces boluensis TaxID=1775135 RepID=A0A964XMU0_9ACTN|nr:hypothetical protein [Streptomyces boluensis]NBE54745.1 hypothetical protein [Streptomyces boluensis]
MKRVRWGALTWQRKALIVFLALCMVWIVGVAAWVGVRLVVGSPPEPGEDEERMAGLHHEQHDRYGRFYVPTHFKASKAGAVVLRYKVSGIDDSFVRDFLRTYDITAEPKRTGPAEMTYSDRFGDMRRTFTVVYEEPVDEYSEFETAARISVRAVPD